MIDENGSAWMSIPIDFALSYDVGTMDSGSEMTLKELARMGESELCGLARTGDLCAFEELVRRYRNDVFALSFHFLRNREDAWDTSQEVFVKALRSLGRFRGDSSFKTWLLRITANQCKDFLKKRRLKTVSLDNPGSQESVSRLPGPDKALEASETGAAILAALDTLPAKQRAAFVLREFESMSYAEMAEVMRCSQGTVMSRLHHARKRLQRALIELGIVEDHQNG